MNDERRPGEGSGGSSSWLDGQGKRTADPRQDAGATPTLFDVEREAGTFDVQGRMVVVERDHGAQAAALRGPGPRRPTTGPQDAAAPAWWTAEAEGTVLALVRSGHAVSSDDLHERYLDEPSATGAAFGSLFARLAARGLIVEVGWTASTRPEARRRRIILWGRP